VLIACIREELIEDVTEAAFLLFSFGMWIVGFEHQHPDWSWFVI
jgi:hypothetical protein